MTLPAAPISFSQTGIPGLNGGYAYPPGSYMTRFMDSNNNMLRQATHLPNGQSVVSWAQGLEQRAALNRQLASTGGLQAPTLDGTAGNSFEQMFQMLMMLFGVTG